MKTFGEFLAGIETDPEPILTLDSPEEADDLLVERQAPVPVQARDRSVPMTFGDLWAKPGAPPRVRRLPSPWGRRTFGDLFRDMEQRAAGKPAAVE